MKKRHRIVLLLSAALLLGATAGFAQDYNGLLAPDGSKHDEPGYRGLIPGTVPDEEQPQKAPPAKADTGETAETPPEQTPDSSQPQITYVPGYKPHKVETVQDIQAIAVGHTVPTFNFDPSSLPEGLADKMLANVTPQVKQGLSKPRLRLNGMLPSEYTTKQQIDALLDGVTNPKISPDQRRINTMLAEQKLELMERSLQARQDASGWVYSKLDLPAVYVSEERESQANSLARLRDAIEVLRHYETGP